MPLLNWCHKCERYNWSCTCDTTTTVPDPLNLIATQLASVCSGAVYENGVRVTDFVLYADGRGIGSACRVDDVEKRLTK